MEAFLKSAFGRIATRAGAAVLGGLALIAVKLNIVIDPESAEVVRAGVEALSYVIMLGVYGIVHRTIKGRVDKTDG